MLCLWFLLQVSTRQMTPQQAAITPNALSILNEFVANERYPFAFFFSSMTRFTVFQAVVSKYIWTLWISREFSSRRESGINKDFLTSDDVSSFSLPKADSEAEAFIKRLYINLHFSLGNSFAYGVGLVESFFFFGIPTTVVSAPFGLPFLFIFGGIEVSFILSFSSGLWFFKFDMTQEVSLNSAGLTMFMGRLSLMCVSALGGILESTSIKLGFTSSCCLLKSSFTKTTTSSPCCYCSKIFCNCLCRFS